MSLHRPGFDILFRERGTFDWPGFGMWGGRDSLNRVVNLDMVHVFDQIGSSVLHIPRRVNARYLVVAGGGAQPGHIIEGNATLEPGQYMIQVGGIRKPSMFSSIVMEPRDVSVQKSIVPDVGYASNIDGYWKRYATGTTPGYYGGTTPGGSGSVGVVVIRYSMEDILKEYMKSLRVKALGASIPDDTIIRTIHALQSILTRPFKTEFGDIDTLLEIITNAYTKKVSEMERHRTRNEISSVIRTQIDALRYRTLRRTIVDAKAGLGLMHTWKELSSILEEEVLSMRSYSPSSNGTNLNNMKDMDKEATDAVGIIDWVREHMSTCPDIPEGSLVADGKDGAMYIYQANALRHVTFDTFRRLSDTRYTLYNGGILEPCQRRPSTSLIQQRTMRYVESPDDVTPIFEPAVFTIRHISSGKALTIRGHTIVLEQTTDPVHRVDQQWKLSGGGYIRSTHDLSLYLTPSPDCTGVIATRDAVTPWNIERLGDQTIQLKNPCGSYLSVDPVDHSIDMVPSSNDLTLWKAVYTKDSSGVVLQKKIKIF
jgi:hypothetical protein